MAFGIGVSYYSISGRKYIKMKWMWRGINSGFRFLNRRAYGGGSAPALDGFIMKFRLYIINVYRSLFYQGILGRGSPKTGELLPQRSGYPVTDL